MSFDSNAFDTSAFDENAFDFGSAFTPGPTTGRSSGGFISGVGRLMVRLLLVLVLSGITHT